MGRKKNKNQRTCYRSTRIDLLGKKRTMIVKRGRNKEKGDHLLIQWQRLIEKEDFFEGKIINPLFRRKRKLVCRLSISAEFAYALCFLLAETLRLEPYSFLKDREMLRVLKENMELANLQKERKERRKKM